MSLILVCRKKSTKIIYIIKRKLGNKKQAGAELCKAQVKHKLKMMMKSKLVVEIVGVQLLFQVGRWAGSWSDETKVILNSTQFKLKLSFAKLQNI